MRASVLLDERSVTAGNRRLPAERGRPGDSGVCVGHCNSVTSTTWMVVVVDRVVVVVLVVARKIERWTASYTRGI